MNVSEYAYYLASLVEDFELKPDFELTEQFYGYFQSFMPSGKNVEKVFEPLEHGNELLDRLVPVYKATELKTIAQNKQGVYPGYFCPNPISDREKVIAYGKNHVEYLKEFAHFSEDKVLFDMLNNVENIELMPKEPNIKDDDLNAYLYDSISDWASTNNTDGELINILGEAYYSINCDYYLSYYFQYPTFEQRPTIDFLKPYFKIWEAGYYCKFDGNKLIIHE